MDPISFLVVAAVVIVVVAVVVAAAVDVAVVVAAVAVVVVVAAAVVVVLFNVPTTCKVSLRVGSALTNFASYHTETEVADQTLYLV